jgi:hypothetical protein
MELADIEKKSWIITRSGCDNRLSTGKEKKINIK